MSSQRHVGKYAGFFEWLRGRTETSINMSFGRVEDILGFPLPASARRYSAYWSGGQPGSTIGNAIRDAGWRALDVNMTRETVRLERAR